MSSLLLFITIQNSTKSCHYFGSLIGTWKEQFDKSNTTKGTFHTLEKDGSSSQREAMLMKTNRYMKVRTDIQTLGGAHGLIMEYLGEEASEATEAEFGAMLLLPPENSIQSMQRMISNLSLYLTKTNERNHEGGMEAMLLQNLIDNEFVLRKVDLTIPRFRVSYGAKSLKSELQTLGMTAAFDGEGMFNQMSNDDLVHLDDVYHKATMEVTEEGTIAAAGTGAVIKTRSFVKPIEMNFDRPFVMMVVHLKTGLPLFIGKIDDPELIF